MVDLASRYECAAVILHSPLMCGLRVAFPDTKKTHCFDGFPCIDRYLKSPLPYFRGTQDEVMAMYKRFPGAVEPLWVKETEDNDIEFYICNT